MSEFNNRNWNDALTKVYERSRVDADYRLLCLNDPVAAVKEVSDIDLPAALKFRFFNAQEDLVYPLLLPPVPEPGLSDKENSDLLIAWATNCSDPTGAP